ncbi:MAG: cupredoxin domain-containing protein [Chloroflexi bacterium]|nr:cupredoxin domain-containing protein [Chloroflexota bacterium]
MGAQRIAGIVALASAGALLVLTIVSSVAGQGWTAGTSGTATGFGMMGGGMGPAMMAGGGMMGGGMGPGMMGRGHMSGLGGTSRGVTGEIAGAPAVRVTATEFKFSPAEITLASREANLSLVNKGVVLHDITIPGLGIRVVAAAGQTTTVGLRDLPAGRYAGYCGVAGHAEAGMRIAVIVQ